MIADLEKRAGGGAKRRFLLRAPFKLPGLVLRGARLERDVDAHEQEAERRRKQITELDLGLLPDDALAQTLTAASDLLLSAGELMLTCASASLASHLALTTWLRRILKRREAHHGDDDAA